MLDIDRPRYGDPTCNHVYHMAGTNKCAACGLVEGTELRGLHPTECPCQFCDPTGDHSVLRHAQTCTCARCSRPAKKK